jgi:hypothetical protein
MSDEEIPQPAAVTAYLRARGWEVVETRQRATWARFRKHIANDEVGEVVLEVPLLGQAPDYPQRFRQFVDDLTLVERAEGNDRGPQSLAREIRTSTSDVIGIRLVGTLPHGRISVEGAYQAIHKTRDLLIAGACAHVEKRPVYSRKKFDRAVDYINRAQFAPPETGSFVMIIETTVPPYLEARQLSLLEPVDETWLQDEPFARGVGLTLARATSTARSLVDDLAVAASPDTAIIESVEEGVSSNLCDALAGLVDPDLSHSLELRFRWAATRKPRIEVPEKVVFDRAVSPYLSTMARTLRETIDIDEFELVGPIYKLTSLSPETGGEIHVSMVEPWRNRKVKIWLDGTHYQRAAQAHTAGQWIAVEGMLTREGSTLTLKNSRNLRVLPIGGSDPD